MADFSNPVAPAWANVRKCAPTDPADASTEDSAINKSAKDLVARTQNLKDRVDAIQQNITGGTATVGAVSGGNGFVVTHNFGTTAHTIDVVPLANPAGTWGEWWIVRGSNTTTVLTNGTYPGTVRWTARRTTAEV